MGDDAQQEAREALYKAIPAAIEELRDAAGAEGQARGLKDLAEAYAWLTIPNQPHG
ncbi:hypothetical protein ACIPSJ_01570 [Streptomyces sp. NPDC090088]|uniref:hypothetical protein n=1 Tax=Streptomyces sp. NPDC090088 TaxID=3365944 RepID=UPI0038148475